jgi:serine/threonine-protein kinase
MDTTSIVHRDDVDRLRRLFARDNCVLGLTIDTRYRVLRRIGQGGMGDVFTAHDLRLDRTVAMKVLSGPAPGPEWLETFQAEAKIMSALEHPGVVPVYDLGALPDGRVYFTMKVVGARPWTASPARGPNAGP